MTLSDFISHDDASGIHGDTYTIGVFSEDDTLVNEHTAPYPLALKVCLIDFSSICSEYDFELEIFTGLESYTPSSGWNNDNGGFYYEVGSGDSLIPYIDYTLVQTACKNTPGCWYTELTWGYEKYNFNNLPSFITYAEGNGNGFTVNTADIFDAGTYTLCQRN